MTELNTSAISKAAKQAQEKQDAFVDSITNVDRIKEKKAEIERKNTAFAEKYAIEITDYAKRNNGLRHPAIYTDETGEYVWLTRQQRRRFLAKRAKAQRKVKK